MDQEENIQIIDTPEAVGNSSASEVSVSETSADPDNEITHSLGQLELYFKNGRKLLTMPGGSLPINDDTRRLLALFSDGSFLVSENHKFDGRVLSFEVLARKKKLMMAKPASSLLVRNS